MGSRGCVAKIISIEFVHSLQTYYQGFPRRSELAQRNADTIIRRAEPSDYIDTDRYLTWERVLLWATRIIRGDWNGRTLVAEFFSNPSSRSTRR